MAGARAQLDKWEAALSEGPYYGRAQLLLPAAIEKVKGGADLSLAREDSPEQPVTEGDYLLVYPDTRLLTLVEHPGLVSENIDDAMNALGQVAAFLTYVQQENLEFNGPMRTGVGQMGESVLLCDPLLFAREDPDRVQAGGGTPVGPVAWSVTPEEQRRCLAALLIERLTNSRGRPLAEMQAQSAHGIEGLCSDLSAAQAQLMARALRTGVSAADLSASSFVSRMQVLSGLAEAGESGRRRGRLRSIVALVLLFVCIAGAVFFTMGRVLG
jgi:hypothetical protein